MDPRDIVMVRSPDILGGFAAESNQDYNPSVEMRCASDDLTDHSLGADTGPAGGQLQPEAYNSLTPAYEEARTTLAHMESRVTRH